MGIEEIGVKSKTQIPEYSSRKKAGQSEGFQESLMQNLKSQEEENPSVGAENSVSPGGHKTGVSMTGSTARIRVNEAAYRAAVQTAEVRNMSYEESDNIEIAVTKGYTLKGKLEGDHVYVEAKYEDGRQEAYHVDTSRVQEQTAYRIEQFALETAQLKKADEYLASGETCGATDSIGIILRQMEEPEAGGKVEKAVIHNGVCVTVTKDAIYGNMITIGGSSKPDWIKVSTSVGTVNIDLNDLDSLMKCLDMFSPEDINAILRKIMEVRQTRDALQKIDNLKNTVVEQAETKEEAEEEEE